MSPANIPATKRATLKRNRTEPGAPYALAGLYRPGTRVPASIEAPVLAGQCRGSRVGNARESAIVLPEDFRAVFVSRQHPGDDEQQVRQPVQVLRRFAG